MRGQVHFSKNYIIDIGLVIMVYEQLVYTLSDLGVSSNLISSQSLANEIYYLPPSE